MTTPAGGARPPPGANDCSPGPALPALTAPGSIYTLIAMRTTLILDDALLREAKKRAAERGTTVSQVVNEALRAALYAQRPRRRPVQLVTFGPTTRPTHHEPSAFKLGLEADDVGRRA